MAEHTAVIHFFGVVNHIGGHAGKGDGQGVEVDGVVVRGCIGIEECGDVLAEDDAATLAAPFLAERQSRGVGVGVLLLALTQALVAQVFTV